MHDFKKPITISDWLILHSSLAKLNVMLRVGQRRSPRWRHTHQVPFPLTDELQRRREEVGRLEELGRSPRSSLTKQLVQMVVEAGMSGEEAPHKEFLKKGLMKRPQKYQLGTVALCDICQYQKSTKLLICKCSIVRLVCKIAQDCR